MKVKDRTCVRLSDGREVWVECLGGEGTTSDGEIRVTIVCEDTRPAGAGLGWGCFGFRHRTRKEFYAETFPPLHKPVKP